MPSASNLLCRGMLVIEKLAALGHTSLDKLCLETKIPKSSVYRILCILEELGYVSRSRNGSGEDLWTLDLKLLGLSAAVLGRIELKTQLRDILVKLADETKEIVQLAVFRNEKVLLLDNVKKYYSLVSVSNEGTSLDINTCVAGFVFGAYMEPEQLNKVLQSAELPKLTKYTITDPNRLRKEFAEVRKTGYAIDDQYHAIGHRCIGAPVFDHTGKIVAEINIAGHLQTISDDRLEPLGIIVKMRAAEASRRLGYTGQ